MSAVLLLGRVIFGGYFLYTGIEHFIGLKGLTGYAKSKGLPMPREGVIVSGLALMFGGLGIVLHMYTGFSVLAILVFLIVANVTMHKFWAEKDPMHAMGDKINFLKNLALIGALLMMLQ